MRSQIICRDCLAGLIKKAIAVARTSAERKREAEKRALSYLETHFRLEDPPPRMAEQLLEIIKEVTQDHDPFREVKREEIRWGKRLALEVAGQYRGGIPDLLALAALGNAIDFFRNLREVERRLRAGLSFALDDRYLAERALERASSILYLADNAGEIFFDLPIMKHLQAGGKRVILAVKAAPVQNDLCLADLGDIGPLPVEVIPSGAFVGLDLDRATQEFKNTLKEVDFILAKGMGHFETMDTLSLGVPVLFILEAKCHPVAEALGVPLASHVCYLREF